MENYKRETGKTKNERFEEYFQEYKNLIMRVVYDRTGDYHMAQEICQQVFVSFYTRMDKVPEDLVKAWLLKSARNAIIDFYRRRAAREEVIDGMTPLADVEEYVSESTLQTYEEELATRELADKILRDVKRVNAQWYEILLLHCVDGLSFAEASERLGVPENVLRARLCRARAYIKSHFGREYEEIMMN